jgi:hypothetical protein
MEQTVTEKLWANPSLLGIGQSEYSISAGEISDGQTKSHGHAATGYYRQGLTNWLTLESGFSSTSESKQFNIGGDIGTDIGNFAGDYSEGTEHVVSVRYSAPVVNVKGWTVQSSAFASKFTRNELDGRQTGVSVSASRNDWSYSSTYAGTERANMFNLSIGHTLQNGSSLSVSAGHFDEFNGAKSNSVFVNLAIPLGTKSIGFSASQTALGVLKSTSMGGTINDQFSGSLNASGVNELENYGGDLSFKVGESSANVGVSQVLHQKLAYRANLNGGMVVTKSGVQATATTGGTDQGFAVVDLKTPGVGVYNGHGAKTFTNDSGVALLWLESLTNNRITIDADTAPDNLDLTAFDAVVARRGVLRIGRAPEVTNGQFLHVPGAKNGDLLMINKVLYPVTDRGAWIDLPAAVYDAKLYVNGTNQIADTKVVIGKAKG